MSVDPENLADAALDHLVGQFTRPLELLRELVQNAVDAGTSRVEVSVRPEPDGDRVRLTVRDWGEGMDEAALDDHLTRLYASSKDGDPTALGRFGVGFASVFAVAPEAVLVRTGRYGEAWELHFHADRTFDAARLDEPVVGTLVALWLRMPPGHVDAFTRACRASLDFWCGHSRVPVTFVDGRDDAIAPPTPATDPFAPFARPIPTDTVTRPHGLLDLDDAAPSITQRADGVEVVVGYGDPPRHAFTRGGLLLATGDARDALGRYADLLEHVSFAVDHDRLEHALTRDRLIRDDGWEEAMQAVLRAREALQRELVARIEARVRLDDDPAALQALHRFLAAECRAPDGLRLRARVARRPVFVDVLGRPVTLEALEAQEQRLGVVVVAPSPDALCEALDERGIRVLRDGPSTRDLLHACEEALHLAPLRQARRIVSACDRWMLVDPVPEEDLAPDERDLLARTAERLRAAAPPGHLLGPGPLLGGGDFGGRDTAVRAPLAAAAPRSGRVVRRERRAPHVLGLRRRPLLVNRHHPLFRAQLLAATEDPDLASLALAQALLDLDPAAPERAWRRLFRQALEDVGTTP